MHNPDYYPTTNNTIISNVQRTYQPIVVQFNTQQIEPIERRLNTLIQQKIDIKQFFYGIELSARSYQQSNILNFNNFVNILPLFTSLVWLGQDYWNVDHINEVESIELANRLLPKTVVLPHFTCYRADRKRLNEFLALNFSNVLALRGDQVDEKQDYKFAVELVQDIRRLRGDTISIGVGGYPEGHPDAKSLESDIKFLLRKVNAGADFIITQICFSSDAIKNFIKNCRSNGINVPIIAGIYIPDNMNALERISEITRVQIPSMDYKIYQQLRDNRVKFREFAIKNAVKMITDLLEADLEIYGVQFFTMNKLKNVQRVLVELQNNPKLKNIIKS